MNAELVLVLRQRLIAKEITMTEAAQLAGVSSWAIVSMLKGLSWKSVTGGEPVDRLTLKRFSQGSQCHQAKLNEQQVAEMRQRLAGGAKGSEMAKEYGVSPMVVSKIRNRQIWTHVA